MLLLPEVGERGRDVPSGKLYEYLAARRAIMEGGAPPPEAVQNPTDRAKLAELRARHANLAALWDKEQLSPRALRVELVNYYIARGKALIDSRFFSK